MIHFSENTIEAFQSAFELGADGIEFDVHLNSRDEVIVVHDYLRDESKNYLKLEDLLERFSASGRLEIEIKSFEIACIEKVKVLLDKYNPINYEITSSILPLLPYIREIIPTAKIGMIFKSYHIENWMTDEFIPNMLLGYMKLTKSNILHLELEKYNQEIASLLYENKYLTHTHLKSDYLKDYSRAVSLRLDQCSFDDINLLKKI